MKKTKVKKVKKDVLPIKAFLTIPVVKMNLRDENGNEIKDVVGIQQMGDAIFVMTKSGVVYSDKGFKFNNL